MKRNRIFHSATAVLVAALWVASPVHALDPFSLVVTVDPNGNAETQTFGFSSMDDTIDNLDPNALSRRFQDTNPRVDAIGVLMNFRGLAGVEIEFPTPAGGDAVVGGDPDDVEGALLFFRIASLGINEIIDTESTRADSLRALLNRLKDKGDLLKTLLTALARFSPIDPIAGNPESLFSRKQKGDLDHGFTHKVSQVWGCGTSAFNFTNDQPIMVAAAGELSDIFADAQSRAAELHAQNELGVGVLYSNTSADTANGSFKSTGIVLPISYTAKLDWAPSHKIRFDFPLSYTDTEGAESYSIGLGMAYTYPVSEVWTLTPALGVGAAGSVDLISAGGVSSYSITSAYTWRLGNYALSMGNSYGQYESIDLEIGDVTAAADIKSSVISNGFMLTGPNSLIAKSLVVEYSFMNTQYGGDTLYMDSSNEIGVSLGHIGTDMGVIDNYTKIGVSYLIGDGQQGDITALKLNLSARF